MLCAHKGPNKKDGLITLPVSDHLSVLLLTTSLSNQKQLFVAVQTSHIDNPCSRQNWQQAGCRIHWRF